MAFSARLVPPPVGLSHPPLPDPLPAFITTPQEVAVNNAGMQDAPDLGNEEQTNAWWPPSLWWFGANRQPRVLSYLCKNVHGDSTKKF